MNPGEAGHHSISLTGQWDKGPKLLQRNLRSWRSDPIFFNYCEREVPLCQLVGARSSARKGRGSSRQRVFLAIDLPSESSGFPDASFILRDIRKMLTGDEDASKDIARQYHMMDQGASAFLFASFIKGRTSRKKKLSGVFFVYLAICHLRCS